MKNYFYIVAILVSGNLQAWDCKYEKAIDLTLDLSSAQTLSIAAGAGDLEILGQSGSDQAKIVGKVCASESEWADEADIVIEGGRSASIGVILPDTDNGWNVMGNKYVYMDLRIEVPDNIALDIRDSSGDMLVESTAGLTVRDSSGDIEIEDINGDVVLNDSSGDIDLVNIEGNVNVRQDSSGDIYGRDIQGMVLVERDSSGDIRFHDVRDDFVVERDSSGDIVGRTIGGDFRVINDSSGSIEHRAVKGIVDIPDKS